MQFVRMDTVNCSVIGLQYRNFAEKMLPHSQNTSKLFLKVEVRSDKMSQCCGNEINPINRCLQENQRKCTAINIVAYSCIPESQEQSCIVGFRYNLVCYNELGTQQKSCVVLLVCTLCFFQFFFFFFSRRKDIMVMCPASTVKCLREMGSNFCSQEGFWPSFGVLQQ